VPRKRKRRPGTCLPPRATTGRRRTRRGRSPQWTPPPSWVSCKYRRNRRPRHQPPKPGLLSKPRPPVDATPFIEVISASEMTAWSAKRRPSRAFASDGDHACEQGEPIAEVEFLLPKPDELEAELARVREALDETTRERDRLASQQTRGVHVKRGPRRNTQGSFRSPIESFSRDSATLSKARKDAAALMREPQEARRIPLRSMAIAGRSRRTMRGPREEDRAP
jgi:hypothetical protein